MFRKPATAIGAAGLIVLASAPAAWGHAEFDSPPSVPAGSDQVITLHVPEERGSQLHNVKVIVEVPSGFTTRSCQAQPEWGCSTGEFATGGALVTFTRTGGTAPDPLFTATVHTPPQAGQHAFKVTQTYSDGTVVIWDGPLGSETPAPVLTVTAPVATPPVTAPAPPGVVDPVQQPLAGIVPAPAAAPETTARPAASAAPGPAPVPRVAGPALPRTDGLPRTGASRSLMVLAGAALLLGGFGIAAGPAGSPSRRARRPSG